MATSKRGFASMDRSKQREIASKGGRAAHAKGTAHEFTSDEARVAGRKGGEAVSRDRAHMAAIGREGGHSRGARARAAAGTASTSGNNNDIAQGSGSQPFVRQANDRQANDRQTNDRQTNDDSSSTSRGDFGSKDRGTSRTDRSSNSGDGGSSSFSSRDRERL